MKKRGGASAKAARKNPKPPSPLLSPLPAGNSPDDLSARRSAKPFGFDDLDAVLPSSTKKSGPTAPSALRPSTSYLTPQKTPASISGLRDLASSRSDALKRSLDQSHSEILKEIEASKSRITKRFKMQTQACMQIVDEAEKEYKKISERINENSDLMKSSFKEFIDETQTSAARVYKVTIPELKQSLEKSIEGLRSRYKIPLSSM